MLQKKQPAKKVPARGAAQPRSKEDAMKRMVEQDPRRAAEMLREILKNK